ncbi:10-formyltetrahydrofolate dehydrogenase [Aphelenchoides besseyi]|nr:10-formyltetrahydrofolate dehydrogenase [Aphelenchoides besseyi]
MTTTKNCKMRIAVIGKSAFGADVYRQLIEKGHNVVLVCTELDKNGRADLLALEAEKNGTPVIKCKTWREKDENAKWRVISSLFEQYKSYKPDLNVLPFCTQFIPPEIQNFPKHRTIIYHPSILPAHRGASAISWTLIHGDATAGLSIFWADDGLDTGPILLQKKCDVEENDTLNTLYKRFLYPEGVKACVEAVQLIADGKAPRIVQPTEGASYEPYITAKPELAEIDWKKVKTAQDLHNFIRGCDAVPGAWSRWNGQRVTFFGSSRWKRFDVPGNAKEIEVEGAPGGRVWTHDRGLLIKTEADGRYVNVESIKLEDGRMIKANRFGSDLESGSDEKLDFTDDEKKLLEPLRSSWSNILGGAKITDSTNFFDEGASSADLTRLVEEVKSISGAVLLNAEVYMCPTFGEFVNLIVRRLRGDDGVKLEFKKFECHVNNVDLVCPTQSGKWMDTIDPNTEEVICKVPECSAKDIDRAVRSADEAFHYGEWSRISPRERGRLMYKLADLMDEHREELATLETLALKTHIGMSIDVWRYFAGWCDKIQGKIIPITEARPNFNMCLATREPIGPVALVVPWNYPFMMLSWKMSACIAAGNTVVLKPAQVTPLTALKFAELAARVGFPPGVINIVTGKGSTVGQALSDHPKVRKLGFTGSTPVGKTIMASCANSNLKKVSLELGGKSPLIIFSDVDLSRVTRQACDAVFFNKGNQSLVVVVNRILGENCIAAGRLFVEEKIHDEFVKRVVAMASKMVIGDPLDRKTDHGPQNHSAHLRSLEKFVEQSVNDGAKVAFGGKRLDRPGLYFYPTVLTDVDDQNFAAKEESFGPIMIISKFKESDIDEVIERANRTEFGLAGGVFSGDTNRALRVARRIKAGTVFVNNYQKTDVAAPFGGFKQSGYGKDLGEEALNEYLQTKTITVEY